MSAALADAGVAVATPDTPADVTVVVVAETLKPEDRVMARSGGPTVVVLNKPDVCGFGAGGPVRRAHRRAAELRALTGLTTVPMIGLLATCVLDDELVEALRVLVREPADLSSVDALVGSPHSLPEQVRRRLLDTLDRFGIAHCVLAIADGADPGSLRTLLRRLSMVDDVVAHVEAAAAPVRYRRVRSSISELRALAAQSGDERLAEFLASDETMLAVMAEAVKVVEADGMHVERGDDRAAHLQRAVRWRRYGNGPVNSLHRQCATDICRGSLRLLGASR